MKIKRFHALTMQEAIRSIKADLGPDAVILSSKRIRKGGTVFGLFGQSMLEVAAAVDVGSRTPLRSPRKPSSPPPQEEWVDEGHDISPPAFHEAFVHSMAHTNGAPRPEPSPLGTQESHGMSIPQNDAREPTIQAPVNASPSIVEPTFSGSWQRHAVTRASPDQEIHPVPQAPVEPIRWTEIDRIKQELRHIRTLLHRPPARHPSVVPQALPTTLMDRCRDLITQGLRSDVARRIVEDAHGLCRGFSSVGEPDGRRAVHEALMKYIHVSGPILVAGHPSKTVLMVGPPGAGKTTTIAKLAAYYRLKKHRTVSLITLDTYRVAAVEQLRTYANVIGVTLDVALTAEEALGCLRRREQADVMLIDTPGRSPFDAKGLEEIGRMGHGAHACEVHLLLSASTRERDLLHHVAGYAGVPINRLLFTKLDETTSAGSMFNLMRHTGLPLSYFSAGQRVPEDLEAVTRERMADLLINAPGSCPMPQACSSLPPPGPTDPSVGPPRFQAHEGEVGWTTQR